MLKIEAVDGAAPWPSGPSGRWPPQRTMADQRAAWDCHAEHEQSPQGLELTPSTAVLWKLLEAYSFQRPEPKRMSDEVLTVLEVAALLKVADKTVYTMAQQGELPAFKVRGQWRFKRDDIDAWIEQQKVALRPEGGRDDG